MNDRAAAELNGPSRASLAAVYTAPEQLLGRPGGTHLVEAVAGSQPGGAGCVPSVIEALGSHQQQWSDAVEGIALAPSVTKGVLLHRPTPHVVDRDVGQAYGVEVVQHHGGVAQLVE